MADDIVTRLRDWADQFGTYEGEQENANDLRDAADEIARLRHAVFLAEKWRDNYKLAWERATGQTLPRGYKETMWNENGTFP